MDNNIGNDLISELPSAITDIILSKLPIVDAIRTCLLSTSWRYKWTSITHLVFDDPSLIHRVPEKKVRFIHTILSLHRGSIQKFYLSSSHLMVYHNIGHWLDIASRKDVQELVIKLGVGKWFYMPPPIFSCNNLIRLELAGCAFLLPANFNGFLRLKYLELEDVEYGEGDIEKLLSSCPLLESLKLSIFLDDSDKPDSDKLDLTVHAQNLLCLSVEGDFKTICLSYTPSLVDVSVDIFFVDYDETYAYRSKCNFHAFFGSIPKLERLIGSGQFIKYLSIGNDGHNCPRNHISDEVVNQNLKFMELVGIEFDEIEQVLVVSRMIRNSPNLKSLKITSSTDFYDTTPARQPPLEIWNDNISILPQLKRVEFFNVNGLPYEVNFIKFVIMRSPNLEVLRISLNVNKFTTETRLHFCVDLLSFRRVYSKADIVFLVDKPE